MPKFELNFNNFNKMNFQKLKEEIMKLTSIESFKSEIQKISQEIKANINSSLSPQAKENIKKLEKKYNELVVALNKAQKQLEAELKKAMQIVKKTRIDVEKKLHILKKSKKGGAKKGRSSKSAGPRASRQGKKSTGQTASTAQQSN